MEKRDYMEESLTRKPIINLYIVGQMVRKNKKFIHFFELQQYREAQQISFRNNIESIKETQQK